ncbi:Mobile element protein [Leucobacter sp. 7(1)]|uniref:site-specific integrase n=1 Tax=Leucobacter sp. 7(1) TaxID=1255613 RepID=UPI00097F2B2E|nr:site-specific integrase [Leucobacter sp. 7(1)]SJN09878.1 Mobile element protein [Leucobacter sp. 7(1)]
MTNELEATGTELVNSPLTEEEVERVVAALAESRSPATRRAYASKWKGWVKWCSITQRSALPASPENVAAYLSEMAEGASLSTVNGAAAAIRAYHEDAGLDDPTSAAGVRRVRAGLTRRLGVASSKQAHALTLAEMRRLVDACNDDGVRGMRDKAVLLIGYAGALRRSELAALQVEDIGRMRDGLVITIRQSKGDQLKAGQQVGVTWGEHKETCPVTALDAWLELLGVDSGPIFGRVTRHNTVPLTIKGLTGESIDQIVKSRAQLAGLGSLPISGHSLRAGHATTVAEHGVDAARIARTTRHVRLETLAKYVRPAQVLKDTTAKELGL